MGRPRKKLIDKKTSIIIDLDNKTWFKFCERLNIEFDKNAEIFNDEIKLKIKEEIIKFIK